MKKYLLGFLILGVMITLSPNAYADWAEISESSTRDVECAGELRADRQQVKQAHDLQLRQLSEQAENLTSVIGTATLSITASASVDNASPNDYNPDAGVSHEVLTVADTGGAAGSGEDGDVPPADDPPLEDPLDDPLGDPLPNPKGDPEEIVPSIPAMPFDPDLPPDMPVDSSVAR